ncbi:hypothetical protein EDD11_009809 [Mortierella claussenii]|nr:hypothetical protein EDD11_009809 [Mortierella claussenii]
MNLDIDLLVLAEVPAAASGGLVAPSKAIHPLLTPPLEPHDDTHTPAALLKSAAAPERIPSPSFPIQVTLLPNKGRSYVATRPILPHELIFVAEAFGTTMCDPWLDCGVCHYCWSTIRDKKSQIRMPRKTKTKELRRQETVMVFCDEVCLDLYGPDMAEAICQVEAKVRRPWTMDVGASSWKIRWSSSVGEISDAGTLAAAAAVTTDVSSGTVISTTASHYSVLLRQALLMAPTREQLLNLSDQNLSCFLNCVWTALDELIAEQERKLKMQGQRYDEQRRQQKLYQALYPALAPSLLQGNNNATIAIKTSDDDCEIIRLISEVLYRRQQDKQAQAQDHSLPTESIAATTASEAAAGGPGPSRIPGERATFADYCAMQSNELSLLRQQLQHDMDEQAGTGEDQAQDQGKEDQGMDREQRINTGDDDHYPTHSLDSWNQLLSLLPGHLLGCFYIYLRLRDSFLLLTLDDPPKTMLSIDNRLFRTILFAEVANSFGIRDDSDELLGFAVFPKACFFNHSCQPNVEKRRRRGGKGRQMEYWSLREIDAGEECCISYGDISTGREQRQARLEEMYFFTCSCPRCLEEEQAE